MGDDKLKVEVAYATPAEQVLVALEVDASTTVEQAIVQSGVLKRCPEINLSESKVGIFSKITTLGARLNDGDRIEIYRPLVIDPKEARRRRARR